MTTESTALVVSLLDKVSGPARKAADSIRGIGGAARSVDGTLAGRLSAALDANSRKMEAVRGRMLDAAAAGYGLYRALKAPLQAFTAFETKLQDLAQKLDVPRAQLPQLGAEIRKVARDTANLSQNIADGFDILAGMGASASDALGMLPSIGKAAVAYRAEIADLSNAGYAALDNLKVPADQFARALDAMAAAGKAGAFELRDMATYFPQLGAAYQGLKQQGVPAVADLAAALQVVRKGTGDASSAATNLGNVLQKVYAPATVRAFGKMGVNIRKEMEKAAKAGMTPIEAIAEITSRVLKGDLSKLGNLFEDAQVQAGLRSLIQGIEEFRRIRAEALKAQGIVEADYQERLKTGAMAGQRFAVAMEAINIAVGSALMPALADLAGAIVPVVNSFAKFAENNPGLTRALVGTAASVVALNVALTAAQFSGLFMFGGLLKLAKGGLLAGKGIAKLTGFLGSLLGVGKAVKEVLPASLEGFGRVSQAVTRNSRAATDASRRMVEGMGAARRASDRMIGGMSAGVGKASTAGFVAYGERAGRAATAGFNRTLAIGGALAALTMILDDLGKTVEQRLEESRKSGEAWRAFSKDMDESWAGKKWKSVVDFFHGTEKPEPVPAAPSPAQPGASAPAPRPEKPAASAPPAGPPASVPLPLPRPAELKKLDEIAAAAKVAFEKIAPALAAEGPKVEGAARSIREKVKSILSPEVKIPVGISVGPGGMGNRLRPAPQSAPPTTPEIDGARATGGPVKAGRNYLVGERGKEIFQPSTDGAILPNRALREFGRAPATPPAVTVHAPISVKLSVHGASAPDLQRLARQAADLVVAEIGSALDRQILRQGQTAFSSNRYGDT